MWPYHLFTVLILFAETDIFLKFLIFDMILDAGNLFKRMNKASTCYATGQEKNFADGFFAGFQLVAEKMGFSC